MFHGFVVIISDTYDMIEELFKVYFSWIILNICMRCYRFNTVNGKRIYVRGMCRTRMHRSRKIVSMNTYTLWTM